MDDAQLAHRPNSELILILIGAQTNRVRQYTGDETINDGEAE